MLSGGKNTVLNDDMFISYVETNIYICTGRVFWVVLKNQWAPLLMEIDGRARNRIKVGKMAY